MAWLGLLTRELMWEDKTREKKPEASCYFKTLYISILANVKGHADMIFQYFTEYLSKRNGLLFLFIFFFENYQMDCEKYNIYAHTWAIIIGILQSNIQCGLTLSTRRLTPVWSPYHQLELSPVHFKIKWLCCTDLSGEVIDWKWNWLQVGNVVCHIAVNKNIKECILKIHPFNSFTRDIPSNSYLKAIHFISSFSPHTKKNQLNQK